MKSFPKRFWTAFLPAAACGLLCGTLFAQENAGPAGAGPATSAGRSYVLDGALVGILFLLALAGVCMSSSRS